MSEKVTKGKVNSTKRQRDLFWKMHKRFDDNISLHRVSIDTIGTYAFRYDEQIFKKLTKQLGPDIKKRIDKKKGEITFTGEEVRLFLSVKDKYPEQGELFCQKYSSFHCFDNRLPFCSDI